VRVTPRSSHPGVEVTPCDVAVRVRSAPEGGKATEEALRVLAKALGVAPTTVSLRSGARSRTKVFDIAGLTTDQILQRLHGG
jgi:uncharacterized protein YggU (UPF0235/DUF167 family)